MLVSKATSTPVQPNISSASIGYGKIIQDPAMLLLESELKTSFFPQHFSTKLEDVYLFCHPIEGDEYATISEQILK